MKFLTLFLCGAVLASVGCKNYDDDITDLNNKIDGLDKGIVELNKLQDRVTAVEKTAAEFKAMDFSQYVTDTELTTKLTEIQNAFNTKLQGYVTTGQLNDAKAALTALINAKCTLDEVKTLLVDYIKKSDVYTKAQIDQMIADINLQFTNLQNNTNDWLGPHFATYMATYVTGEEFKGAVSAAILAQLTSANQAFVDAIQNLMNGDDAVLRQSDLDEIKGGYDDEIAKIWLAIGNLASRIQSLVFVPTTSVGGGAIMYGPQMAGAIALTSSAKAEVTFRVTPASLAASLVDAFKVGKVMISFKAEEVTRAGEPTIEILNVAAGTDGKIVLLTSTDYDFDTNDKNLAIALNIADVPAEGETMQGIEFSSAYVFAKASTSTSTDVKNNFVLAKANADATGFVDYATSANYELPFNAPATQVVTLLGEYSLMYKSGTDYMTIAEAAAMLNWDVVPTMAIVNGTPVLSAQPAFTVANYTITPTAVNNSKVNVKVAVKTIDPLGGQIAATYTVPTTVNLTDGVKTEAIVTASSVLTITKATLAEVTNANATINWNYAKYAADSYASGDVIIPTGKLTAAQFNAIAWTNVAWTVTTPTGSPVVGTVVVKATKVSTPTTDNDAQIINYTITGYKNGTGAVNISADVAIGGTTQVKVSGAVTFNGLPDLAYTIATPVGGVYSIGTPNITMDITTTFNSAMYSALPTGQTFFANAAEFDTFLATLTVENVLQTAIPAKNIAEATVAMSLSNKTMSVNFTTATVDFNKASSYTYTASATAALSVKESNKTFFKIALSGSATINKANGYFLGQGVGIYTDAAVPYMIAQGKTVTATPAFTIDNVNLATGYAAVVPSNNTKTIAVIYTLKTTSPSGYNGTLPTISNEVLAWNNCALGVVTVEASMTVDGVTIDAKTFEVKLQQPITFNWAAFTTAAIPVASDGVATATANMFAIMQPTTPEQTYCRDIFGNALINATSVETWAANVAAYGLAVTFSEPTYTSSTGAITFDRFSFNATTGEITVGASNAPIAGVVTAVVKVDFTYKYAEELVGAAYAPKKFSNTITVKFQNQ